MDSGQPTTGLQPSATQFPLPPNQSQLQPNLGSAALPNPQHINSHKPQPQPPSSPQYADSHLNNPHRPFSRPISISPPHCVPVVDLALSSNFAHFRPPPPPLPFNYHLDIPSAPPQLIIDPSEQAPLPAPASVKVPRPQTIQSSALSIAHSRSTLHSNQSTASTTSSFSQLHRHGHHGSKRNVEIDTTPLPATPLGFPISHPHPALSAYSSRSTSTINSPSFDTTSMCSISSNLYDPQHYHQHPLNPPPRYQSSYAPNPGSQYQPNFNTHANHAKVQRMKAKISVADDQNLHHSSHHIHHPSSNHHSSTLIYTNHHQLHASQQHYSSNEIYRGHTSTSSSSSTSALHTPNGNSTTTAFRHLDPNEQSAKQSYNNPRSSPNAMITPRLSRSQSDSSSSSSSSVNSTQSHAHSHNPNNYYSNHSNPHHHYSSHTISYGDADAQDARSNVGLPTQKQSRKSKKTRNAQDPLANKPQLFLSTSSSMCEKMDQRRKHDEVHPSSQDQPMSYLSSSSTTTTAAAANAPPLPYAQSVYQPFVPPLSHTSDRSFQQHLPFQTAPLSNAPKLINQQSTPCDLRNFSTQHLNQPHHRQCHSHNQHNYNIDQNYHNPHQNCQNINQSDHNSHPNQHLENPPLNPPQLTSTLLPNQPTSKPPPNNHLFQNPTANTTLLSNLNPNSSTTSPKLIDPNLPPQPFPNTSLPSFYPNTSLPYDNAKPSSHTTRPTLPSRLVSLTDESNKHSNSDEYYPLIPTFPIDHTNINNLTNANTTNKLITPLSLLPAPQIIHTQSSHPHSSFPHHRADTASPTQHSSRDDANQLCIAASPHFILEQQPPHSISLPTSTSAQSSNMTSNGKRKQLQPLSFDQVSPPHPSQRSIKLRRPDSTNSNSHSSSMFNTVLSSTDTMEIAQSLGPGIEISRSPFPGQDRDHGCDHDHAPTSLPRGPSSLTPLEQPNAITHNSPGSQSMRYGDPVGTPQHHHYLRNLHPNNIQSQNRLQNFPPTNTFNHKQTHSAHNPTARFNHPNSASASSQDKHTSSNTAPKLNPGTAGFVERHQHLFEQFQFQSQSQSQQDQDALSFNNHSTSDSANLSQPPPLSRSRPDQMGSWQSAHSANNSVNHAQDRNITAPHTAHNSPPDSTTNEPRILHLTQHNHQLHCNFHQPLSPNFNNQHQHQHQHQHLPLPQPHQQYMVPHIIQPHQRMQNVQPHQHQFQQVPPTPHQYPSGPQQQITSRIPDTTYSSSSSHHDPQQRYRNDQSVPTQMQVQMQHIQHHYQQYLDTQQHQPHTSTRYCEDPSTPSHLGLGESLTKMSLEQVPVSHSDQPSSGIAPTTIPSSDPVIFQPHKPSPSY